MTQRRLLFLVLAPIVLVPLLLASSSFLGKRAAFGLVGLLAITLSLGLMTWMRKVSQDRTDLMRRLGFTHAPGAAAELSRDARLGRLVTGTTWTVMSDRAFQGTSFGVPVTYFDAHREFGGDPYNAATVVGARISELLQTRTPLHERRTAEAGSGQLQVIESNGVLFCFRPEHMVPDNEIAILDFLHQAMPVLVAEAERSRASH